MVIEEDAIPEGKRLLFRTVVAYVTDKAPLSDVLHVLNYGTLPPKGPNG